MSAVRPTSVCFLWHMHQPWYGDARTGRMVLPWVRLHATKDYLDMIALAEEHPEVHLTFNLVPSLLRQIQDYVTGATTDDALELSQRPAADLTDSERCWLLANAFKCYWPLLVEPYPRFRDLLGKRGRDLSAAGLADAAKRFSPQDLRDLQVWFNLAWCGHELRRREPVVAALLRQGRDYSEDDKTALLDRLTAAVAEVIPRHVKAAAAGHVELATSPYYHPILPLLCHWPDARVAMPGCRLPPGVEDLPNDAERQLRAGRELCVELLGQAPVGLWPSEGSVSRQALELAAAAGFRWAATDEQILALSLQGQGDPSQRTGRTPQAKDFLQPHQHAGVNLFFREHRASDKIGFDYASWSPEAAVGDLLKLLERTAANGGDLARPVISVILDGENCWEYYRHNGHDFLDRLYGELARHPYLRPVTFSEHLAAGGEPPALTWLFPGSWINHDFYIWAGHREDQRAWELLFATRRALVGAEAGLDEATRRQAWEHLAIAEGSDWFWWYGDDHSSADDGAFDELYRGHLTRVWELCGLDPPAALAVPICGLQPASPLTSPVAPVTPVIDGRESTFYEWRGAGRLEGRQPAGAMSRGEADSGLQRVRFGFDEQHLYLAIELAALAGDADSWALELAFTADGRVATVTVPAPSRARPRAALPLGQGRQAMVAVEAMLELAVPLAALPCGPGAVAELAVTLRQGSEEVERWPERGAFEFPIPDDDLWLGQWIV